MVKQGGDSWNHSPRGKKGITTRYKCSLCGRGYKQDWSLKNHEKACRLFNNSKK